MEAMKMTGSGVPILGIVVVALFFVAALWDALSSGATFWALGEPIGVLVVGVGLVWLPSLVPWNIAVGVPLIAIGGYVIKGYRWGFLPRQPERDKYKAGRYKLPPL
jgi:hypothetical protein